MNGSLPKRATITELTIIAELSDVSLRKHIRKAKIPKGRDGKYNVQKILNAILKHRKEDKNGKSRGIGEEGSKFKEMKDELSCKLLHVKIDQLLGKLITVSDHHAELAEYAAMVNSVFDQFEKYVAAMTRNAALREKARLLTERAKRRLMKAVEDSQNGKQ